MAYSYNKVNDSLTFKGKKVKGIKHASNYLLQTIERGQNFSDFPAESQVLSTLADIMLYLNEKNPRSLQKAEKMRLVLMRETTLQAADQFRKTPSKLNEALLIGYQKNLTLLSKDMIVSDDINITVESLIHNDFWDKEHIPEVPRIDGKTVTVEEYILAKKL